MPNWCFNNVIVSAKTEQELVEFLDFADQTHTSYFEDWKTKEVVMNQNAKGVFWNFVTPTDLFSYFGEEVFKKTDIYKDDKFDNEAFMAEFVRSMAEDNDWYHWNCRNWGTKWDIELERENISIDKNDKTDGYFFNWHFSTAWSPAEGAYRAMAERFPNLTFDYEITEEANFYAGKLHFANGELVDEVWVDSPTHADFMLLDIPCDHCMWGMELLDLSETDVEALEEMSYNFFDDCPATIQIEKRIAELTS